jgi:citrate synthase
VFVAPTCQSRRGYSSSKEEGLKEAMVRLVPEKRELLKKVKALGDKKLGDVKVENALGGMRYLFQSSNHRE